MRFVTNNSAALLVTSIAPFVVILAWSAAVTAGHTKRVTMNAIVMIGYAVGNSAGPQYWKKVYQPRYISTPLTLPTYAESQ